MSGPSDKISALIDQAAPKVAVVFSGSVPRLIGSVEEAPTAQAVKLTVDVMLLEQRLSATNISIATCYGKRFVLAHG